jgi:hypothetical protein
MSSIEVCFTQPSNGSTTMKVNVLLKTNEYHYVRFASNDDSGCSSSDSPGLFGYPIEVTN